MQELILKEVQKIALSLLIEFDNICKAQSLRYSLGGGTLLGAVRHNGFIPWDDDIDVMMPRPDYEKFLKYCTENLPPFDVLSYQNNSNYTNLFIKIADRHTKSSDGRKELEDNIGVCIDIFPIDGLGDSFKTALKNFNRTKFRRELLVASKWRKFFKSKTRPIYFEPIRLGMYLISRFVNKQKLCVSIDESIKSIKFENSRYSGCVSGSYREREIMGTETFVNYTTLSFENREFDVISDYHEYLRQHYGDYMKLPPVDKRITHHSIQFYWKINKDEK